MLPWPDNFFLNTASGSLTNLSNATFPHDNSGQPIDPVAGGWSQLKGFNPMPQITAYLPEVNLDFSKAPRLWDIDASLTPGGPTILLNTATGQPVAHWVELDYSSNDVPGEYPRALLLWPATQLNFSTRYVVAFRNLIDDQGEPLAPSDGFAALKYNRTTNNPALEASRPRFEAVFGDLAGAGWSREALTLAWDFTTGPKDDLTGALRSVHGI